MAASASVPFPPALAGALAGAIALSSPFASFLRFYRYDLLRPEAIVSLSLLGGLGALCGLALGRSGRTGRTLIGGLLLGLFLDLQFPDFLGSRTGAVVGLIASAGVCWVLHAHLPQILGVALATFAATSWLSPDQGVKPLELGTGQDRPVVLGLPVVLHVIFDEHIGIEGLPEEIPGATRLARELRDAYLERGFRLYSRAFSSFFYTKNSLSHLVNLQPAYDPSLAESGEDPFQLAVTRNAYFRTMQERGYRLRVYQSDYIDFCAAEGARPFACHTENAWTLGFLPTTGWSVVQKVTFFARLCLSQSQFYSLVRRLYAIGREALAARGVAVPGWAWGLSRTPSGFQVLDRLRGDLASARPGDLFFAHVLLPHSPLGYDATCALRPHSQWRERRDRGNPRGRGNTPEGRASRYAAYLEQVRCVDRQVAALLAAFDASPAARGGVVVLHGDHGSRIGLYDPWERHRERLTDADYVDAFSTLFAVRADGVEAGVDRELVSIQALFARLVRNGFRLPAGPDPGEEPLVHFTSSGKRASGSRRMVDFGLTRYDNRGLAQLSKSLIRFRFWGGIGGN